MNKRAAAVMAATMLAGWAVPAAAATTLTTGTGDGSVTLSVLDGGGFGSSTDGQGGSDAIYDPVGTSGQGGTVYRSSLFLGLAGIDARADISTAAAQVTSATASSVTSNFAFGELGFLLVQDLSRLLDNGVQTGSRLTQSYTITNNGASAATFDLIRYLDADIGFTGTDGRLDDGGGRYLAADGTEVLFETDQAIGSSQSDTFVGITNEGGAANGYEVSYFASLRDKLANGGAPNNAVQGDGPDADQFIDQGGGYDTSLALSRRFTLGVGQSAVFTTRTFFGTGVPETVVVPPSGAVPEPGTWALMLLGFGAVGAAVRRPRRAAVRFA